MDKTVVQVCASLRSAGDTASSLGSDALNPAHQHHFQAVPLVGDGFLFAQRSPLSIALSAIDKT